MHRLILIFLLLITGPAQAAVCNVPASYASIQAAVNDSNCSEIQLSPGQYEGSVNISRSLTLSGSGSNRTVVNGVVSVSGNGTQATIRSFRIRGDCFGSRLVSSGGASVTGSFVISELLSNPGSCPVEEMIFRDGFETSP